MYSGKCKLLIASLMTSIFVTLAFCYKFMVTRNMLLLYMTLFFLGYTIYIFIVTNEEYQLCKLDASKKPNEEILKLFKVETNNKFMRSGTKPVQYDIIATFESIAPSKDGSVSLNAISLVGNFKNVDLVVGELYQVKYFEHTRIVLDIKSYKKEPI